ncbi:MAG: MBL fold metallo-hydrolase [Anaerolineales bacterium]|jgi:ribonuclease Z|nr:MBL fold metallo-hydrolase [Anaerolineales bacterium]
MAQLTILGSSNAIPSLEHDNTHLVLATKSHTILVDCASNSLVRLEMAGIDFRKISDIVLTHFHPDHVGGIPLLLMNLWLLGRTAPLNIYGLHYTLDRVETMMGLYSWGDWPEFFPVNFCRIPADPLTVLMDNQEVRIYASPVKHFVPNIGLRVELKPQAKSLAYSCDTEPCPAVFELARNVDLLFHEATGPLPGHSSASQAADVARAADVGELILIHYPTGRLASGDLIGEAAKKFSGPIRLAQDFMVIDL